MRKRLLFLAVLFASFNASAQGDSVSLLCSFVGDDGSVTLTWDNSNALAALGSPNYQTFNYYLIGVKSSNGNIVITDTIPDINTTNAASNYNNPNNGIINFVITASFSPNNFLTAEINTIYVRVTQTNSTNILLEWNNPHLNPDYNPTLKGNEGQYFKIYRNRMSNGINYELIDSILFNENQSQLRFVDNILPSCNDTLTYYITIDDSYGCTSRSNKSRVVIGDNDKPSSPVVASASTDIATQKVGISWIASNDTDVAGYVLCSGYPCTPLDTIEGRDSTYFVCDTCDATKIYDIAIESYDSCWNTSLLTDKHNNIVVNAKREQCSDSVRITWNPYNNMTQGLKEYNIYSSEDSINFALAAHVFSYDTSAMVHINTSAANHYFYVKATGNLGYESTSNIVKLSVSSADMPQYMYIRSVSVREDNKHIDISFFVDSLTRVPNYKLRRSEDGTRFADIATLSFSGEGSFSYVDAVPASAAEKVYTYLLTAWDFCYLDSVNSNVVSSMRLSVSQVSDQTNKLTWNAYDGWNAVNNYDIYRSDAAIGSSYMTTFDDNSADMAVGGYGLRYNVVATESGVGADGKQATASSSYADIRKESLCWIPNAFTPDGEQNTVFKPSLAFIKEGSYQMRIYNRYGQVLFYTNDISQGWDGTYEGQRVNPGTYIYLIEFTNSKEAKQVRRGTVVLVD
ncbi:MAG: gliding motility-associated C-terminal domain-containing protein [Bacteroidales bacterium]|nr:gliding motility-associated C-terminal domain-containing protein [Bacteroidales bacterium]